MDAPTLFRQGVLAIREQNDPARGRALLLRALDQDPQNELAWLWLTRTVPDAATRLEYVERALAINPANEAAQRLRMQLHAALGIQSAPPPEPERPSTPGPPANWLTPDTPPADVERPSAPRPPANWLAPDSLSPAEPERPSTPRPPAPASDPPSNPVRSVIQPLEPKTVDEPVTPAEATRIAQLMDRGDSYAEAGAIEDAIAQWVEVLKIRVDHEQALRSAAGNLWKLGYQDDARELVQRALNAGTRVPSVILTALDMAERQRDTAGAERLRQQIAAQPGVDEQLVVKIADYYVGRFYPDVAERFLLAALDANPDSQQVMIRLGDLLTEQQRGGEAMAYYDRAVRVGGRSQAAREADKRLAAYVPVLTDRERGSVWLAARETLGIGLIFLVLAVQDAGLSLLAMGPRRWAGVALSLLGGYLVVTATSSPQQKPVAGWLGGEVPPRPEGGAGVVQPHNRPGAAAQDPTALPLLPRSVRIALAVMGLIVLALAFVMVFPTALELVSRHTPPYLPGAD